MPRIARRLSAAGVLAPLLFSAPVTAQQVEHRTANNGNVLLEDVPPVPAEIVDALNRYQNVRSAAFRDFTEDGEGLYISTRFGDLSQLHRVDFPGGARRQLTFFPEPVGGAMRRPGSADLLISMDEGGSEFYQLYALDARSGEHRLLTDGTSRNGSPVFSLDGAQLAFTSTRRDGRSNDIWLLDGSELGSARLLLTAPDTTSWAAADFDKAGGRLLVTNYVSITDSRLHLLDVETGALTRIAGGGDEEGNFSSITPRFGADGNGFFFATDLGSELTRLAYQDLATGERRIVTADIPWDIEDFAISDDGSRAAFVVNEDGMSRLYLLDPQSLTHERIEGLPAGVIGAVKWSPDASRLALTLNTPRTPSDVFTLSVNGERELTRWTYSEIGGLDPESFIEPELIRYATFDDVDGSPREIPAFVYRPAGEGPFPVIVNIHGGPESQYRPTFSSTVQLWLARLGAAVIAPNVRGSSGYGRTYVQLDNGRLREDSVRDIGALLDWIAEQPDLDETRVAVVGGSYGGYMVLASAVHYSERLAAAAETVGISNFVTFLENTEAYRRDVRRPEYGDERDPAMREFLESISPSNHADRIRVPLLVAQGQNDPRVPVSESEQIVRAVRQNGRDVWYMNALNEGHGFRRKENADLFAQVLVMFFERYLASEASP